VSVLVVTGVRNGLAPLSSGVDVVTTKRRSAFRG